jgi:hypothetical protein
VGRFETSDRESSPHLRPLRVPSLKDGVFGRAKEMVADLAGWTLVSEDAAGGVLVCERKARLLGGKSRITIRIDGPDGIPSTTVHVVSESDGGILSHDKSNVAEFLKPFHRRIC